VALSLICSGMTRLRALVPWGFLFLTRSEPHKDQINGARKMISDSSFLLLIVAWHEKLLAQLNHGSFYVEYNFKVCCVFSFAFTPCLQRILLKSGLVWWVDLEPGIGIEPDWRKNRGRKNPEWPSWFSGLTRQDPVKNPITTRWLFFFY